MFQEFRNNSIKNYVLCPSHYFSAPALSWDVMLKMTKYSKANNKYLKSYDPKQESKHIIYLEVNNLYGYAMSKQ